MWSYGAPVYLPSFLYGIGQGAIIPAIPFSARELDASVAGAGLVVAVLGLGQLGGTLPAGQLVARAGEKRSMILAALIGVAALVLCVVASSVWVLAVGVGVTGATMAVFGLARHAYLTEVAPLHQRARALSTLGGVNRIGVFIGPFLGAAIMGLVGTAGGFWVFVVAATVSIGVLLAFPDVEHSGRDSAHGKRLSTYAVIRRHLPVLRTLGMGVLIIGAVRASRQVVIPLWADHLGLSPATSSVIFGISGAVDMLLFYPAGWVMDRVGRRWAVVPCMVLLGLSHILLPLAGSAASLIAVAMLMGFANGIGSGIVMTLGSDASPTANRAVFLGAWRLCGSTGSTLGPLAISGITAMFALGPAAIAMGAVAWFGAVAMARWIPRYGSPPARRPPIAG